MARVPFSQDLYVAASHFAARAHGAQKFPGSEEPYFVHLAQVAMEVTAALAEDPVEHPDLAVQCALLHDCAEDAGVSIGELAQRFGPEVAAGVDALTKRESVPKAERMADSLARIRQQPREIWMVKLADRICNMQAPPHYWTREKCRSYRGEAEQILGALSDGSAYLARRLADKIAAYEQHWPVDS